MINLLLEDKDAKLLRSILAIHLLHLADDAAEYGTEFCHGTGHVSDKLVDIVNQICAGLDDPPGRLVAEPLATRRGS